MPFCRTPNWLTSLCLSRKVPLSGHYVSKIFKHSLPEGLARDTQEFEPCVAYLSSLGAGAITLHILPGALTELRSCWCGLKSEAVGLTLPNPVTTAVKTDLFKNTPFKDLEIKCPVGVCSMFLVWIFLNRDTHVAPMVLRETIEFFLLPGPVRGSRK